MSAFRNGSRERRLADCSVTHHALESYLTRVPEPRAGSARSELAEVAREVQRLWLDRRRDDAAALIPDDLILKSNLIGTEAMIRARLRAHRDAGVNTLRVSPEGATPAARLATLARLVALVAAVTEDA